jgi:hypothetical protein
MITDYDPSVTLLLRYNNVLYWVQCKTLKGTLLRVLMIGPSMLVYIFVENHQMHQNYHFIVMLNQTLLHVSAYQRRHQGAHITLTSYLYFGVHYRKNNGISSK